MGAEEDKKLAQSQIHAFFVPQAYSPEVDWNVWLEMLEMYMLSKNIQNEADKKMLLLQCVGMQILTRLMKWVAPKKPREKSYDELIKLLGAKFAKASNKFSSRVKLFNEKQLQGQSEQEYIAHMTELAGDCEFETMTNPQEENTVLAILRGLKDTALREYLMNPRNDISTVEKLQALAIQFAMNRKSAKDICLQDSAERANPSPTYAIENLKESCKQCGLMKHFNGECPAKGKPCNFCKKVGHFEKACYKKHEQGRKIAKIEEFSDDEYPGILSLGEKQVRVPALMQRVKINGRSMKMLLDTGAMYTVIPEVVWKQIGSPKLRSDKSKLRGYCGWISVLGSCKVTAQIGSQVCDTQVKVVKKGALLVGRDWIKLFKIVIDPLVHGDKGVEHQVEQDLCSKIDALLEVIKQNERRLECVEQVVAARKAVQEVLMLKPLEISNDLEEENAKEIAKAQVEDRVEKLRDEDSGAENPTKKTKSRDLMWCVKPQGQLEEETKVKNQLKAVKHGKNSWYPKRQGIAKFCDKRKGQVDSKVNVTRSETNGSKTKVHLRQGIKDLDKAQDVNQACAKAVKPELNEKNKKLGRGDAVKSA